MDQLLAAVAAGDHPDAAALGRRIAEGEPDRRLLVRVEPVIGRVLVPGHVGRIARSLEPEGRQVDQDVRAEQVLDRVQNRGMARELDQPGEDEVPLDAEPLGRVDARLALVVLDPPAERAGVRGAHRLDREDIAVAFEGSDLSGAQHLAHDGLFTIPSGRGPRGSGARWGSGIRRRCRNGWSPAGRHIRPRIPSRAKRRRSRRSGA